MEEEKIEPTPKEKEEAAAPPPPEAAAAVPPPAPAVSPPLGTGNAVAALVFGIIGLVICPIIGGILALVFGYRSRSLGEPPPAPELSVVARILGWVSIGFYILMAILYIVCFVVFAAFGAAVGRGGWGGGALPWD